MNEMIETLKLFKQQDDVIELRVIDKGSTFSGYFTNVEKAVKSISQYNGKANIYFVLNKIKKSCYSRINKDVMMNKVQSTSDNDIEKRDWILIDLDPKRESGISSTEQEKRLALELAKKVYTFLKDKGFKEPIICDSGNGYHLMYKVDMPIDEKHNTLIKEFLNTLGLLFSNDFVEIDLKVFNPARITKLYGSIAVKGANTIERPHRTSKLYHKPNLIQNTDELTIEKVIIKKEEPKYQNNYERFDLENFLDRHNLRYKKVSYGGGVKYVLDECPFNHEHGKDSAVFQLSNGAIGFYCFHNSCSGNDWHKLREMYEPKIEYKKITKEKQPIVYSENDFEKDFITTNKIKKVDKDKLVYIKTGINTLDRKIGGYIEGQLSVWSGINSSGKSAFLTQEIIEFCKQGYKVMLYSGEMQDYTIQNNLYRLTAGKRYCELSDSGVYYYVKDENVKDKINNWFDNKLFIYKNSSTMNAEYIVNSIRYMVIKKGIKIVILDNLMTMDLRELDKDKYEAQSILAKQLTNLCKELQIHIHIVMHPRKTTSLLRKEDISGSADLSNAVDNVFIVHRNNNDFQKRSSEMLGLKKDDNLYTYDNIIEVCKNREEGIQDLMVGMYFEPETKRFLNYKGEEKRYYDLCL